MNEADEIANAARGTTEIRTDDASQDAAAGFRLETHLFYHFSQVLERRNQALNAALRPFGLDFARWRVLAVLREHGGCSMGKLSELTAVDRTTLAHTVRLMEAEALLVRARRDTDRRSVALDLTPEGRAQLERILPLVVALTARAVAGLKPADLKRLETLLRRMTRNLKD